MKIEKKYDKLWILVMGAQADISEGFTFEDEFRLALDTWAKELPDDVHICYYDGGKYMKSEFVDDETHKNVHWLHLACEDDMKWTFKKTWMAYKYIYDNFEPEWIFRTNTSTYINVDVLEDFVNEYANTQVTYGSDLYSLSEACCPWPLCIYPRGNGILTHKEVYKPCIVENGIQFAYSGVCDDIVFGCLINSYNINKGRKYTDYIKGLPHAWYKCVDVVFDNGHKFSKYGDSTLDYHNFVSITVKKYRDRGNEKKHYLELYNRIENDQIAKHANPKWTNEMLEYVNDYSVFLGSILGYLDFDKWNSIDKNELFLKEISHKASDDEQHYIYKEIQGKDI